MARELPEAGMAAELPAPELGMVALYIAVGCAEVLKPLLDFLLEGACAARSPVLDAAAAAVVLTVPVAYLAGVVLLYLHVAPAAAGAALPPAAIGSFSVLVSALLLFMAFIFFLAAGVR
ncbi:unnamed protein product [Urochloa humidicola]